MAQPLTTRPLDALLRAITSIALVDRAARRDRAGLRCVYHPWHLTSMATPLGHLVCRVTHRFPERYDIAGLAESDADAVCRTPPAWRDRPLRRWASRFGHRHVAFPANRPRPTYTSRSIARVDDGAARGLLEVSVPYYTGDLSTTQDVIHRSYPHMNIYPRNSILHFLLFIAYNLLSKLWRPCHEIPAPHSQSILLEDFPNG